MQILQKIFLLWGAYVSWINALRVNAIKALSKAA